MDPVGIDRFIWCFIYSGHIHIYMKLGGMVGGSQGGVGKKSQGLHLFRIETMTKSNLGNEGFIFPSSLQSTVEGSQSRNSGGNLAAGAEAEAMESCLLPCSPWLVEPVL